MIASDQSYEASAMDDDSTMDVYAFLLADDAAAQLDLDLRGIERPRNHAARDGGRRDDRLSLHHDPERWHQARRRGHLLDVMGR